MGKYYIINLCLFLAKFYIHKHKFTGSKPLFTIQSGLGQVYGNYPKIC